MPDQRFDIFFSGTLLPGTAADQARARLQERFRLSAAQVAAMFSGQRVAVKKGVDMDSAVKYRVAFRQAGAHVDIVPHETASAAAPHPALSLGPLRQGDLLDCAPPAVAPFTPDLSGLGLDDPRRPLDQTPAPAPAAIDSGGLSAAPPRSGDLSDCAPAPVAVSLPDGDALALDSADRPLDERPPPPPPQISLAGLSAAPARSGDLSDCQVPPPVAPRPSIQHLDLVPP